MTQLFTNNAVSALASGITDVATSLTVTTGEGALFPSPTGGDFFMLTLTQAGSETSWEVVKVTARTGDALTIVRAQDGTTAAAWGVGAKAELRVTAEALNGKQDAANKDASGGYAGLTLFKLNLRNAANTFTNFLTNTTTAARTWIMPDYDGTVATLAGTETLTNKTIDLGSNTLSGTLAQFNTAVSDGDFAKAGANTDIISLGAVTSMNGGQLAGLRNKIINGKMEIAQRGSSFAGIVAGAISIYAADRFGYGGGGNTAVATVSQQSDAPSDEFQFSGRVTVTTADSAVAAGDSAEVFHSIEGYNARDLIGRTFTLSFWVRSSKVGIHCVSLRSSTDNRSYVAEYTVSAANTWEKKAITVTGGLITAGAWNWTTGRGVLVGWTLMAGSTNHTTPGAWQTGAFSATANQVNCLDTIGNIFAITGVQLELGSVATQFEHRPYGMELALCQRYYQTVHAAGIAFDAVGICSAMTFLVGMRTNPTCTFSGNLRKTSDGSLLTATSPIVASYAGGVDFFYASSWSTALVVGQSYDCLGTSGVITASAEL